MVVSGKGSVKLPIRYFDGEGVGSETWLSQNLIVVLITMLLELFKNVIGCVLNPSKVEQFWRIRHGRGNILECPSNSGFEVCIVFLQISSETFSCVKCQLFLGLHLLQLV